MSLQAQLDLNAQASANLEMSRARLRGAMEGIFEIVGGLRQLDEIVQHERQMIHDRHPELVAEEGFIG